MPTRFFIGDTHFGHKNLLGFKREDGTPLRPFTTIEEMDEILIQNWNSVVKKNDIVYHLGDVALQSPNLDLLYQLNGLKYLIMGNHDNQDISQYAKHFERLNGARVYGDFILSHIPIHPKYLERWPYNIHGHMHAKCLEDKRFINVSVEQTNYTPISLEEIKAKVECR